MRPATEFPLPGQALAGLPGRNLGTIPRVTTELGGHFQTRGEDYAILQLPGQQPDRAAMLVSR